MSEENVDALGGVRTPVAVPAKRSHRSLDQRIFLRFPALVRVIASAWSRLPPRSRLRRAMLSRNVRQGFAALNRRDLEASFLNLDPEIEFTFGDSPLSGFVPPDLLGVHYGHAGLLRTWEAVLEAFADIRIELEEVLDYGDRVLSVGRVVGHGSGSGVSVNDPYFAVFMLRRGMVIREEDFTDRNKALEAAGLSE